jgi:heme/copper-type cytochrome/quinol oxidase subunit 3
MAVVLKSVLFAVFERRLPRLRAAWRMFLGNVLTSFVGLLVALMIASSPSIWLIGVPVVCFLCWLPTRRLVKAAPLTWLARISPATLAGIMSGAMVASSILFIAGQGALETRQQALYWIIKLAAIALALFPSITLTTVWEEWVIWRLSARPEGIGFFASVLRANLYVLLLLLAVPAVLILPKRLKSPDFTAQRHNTLATQTTNSLRRAADNRQHSDAKGAQLSTFDESAKRKCDRALHPRFLKTSWVAVTCAKQTSYLLLDT